MAKVSVFGSGAWGCALSCIAARAGHDVVLWGRSKNQIEEIKDSRTNSSFLGDLILDAKISPTNDLSTAITHGDIFVLATPTQSLRDLLASFGDISKDVVLLSTCKGVDQKTLKLPHDIIGEVFPNNAIATLSGPSFASDVVLGLPTAVSVASSDVAVADELAKQFSADGFRCYSTDDIKGVELGGALKNVLALAVGIADGLKLGASAKAALIARGFAEITRLATELGAKPDTLSGLSGLGDITLSCSSTQSRNFTYGKAIAEGLDLSTLKLAEGSFTASAALKMASESGVNVPITQAIVSVLEKSISPREAVSSLLDRPLKREN